MRAAHIKLSLINIKENVSYPRQDPRRHFLRYGVVSVARLNQVALLIQVLKNYRTCELKRILSSQNVNLCHDLIIHSSHDLYSYSR